MAVTPVSLGPSLRAWSLAGVTHILCDGPIDAAHVDADASQPPIHASRSSPAASLPISPPQTAMRISIPSKTRMEATEPLERSTRVERSSPESSGRENPPRNGPLVLPRSDDVPADPRDWPFPWGERLSKSIKAPILWTYHELGEDLLGTGGSDRGAFFKSLIGDLRLPKGSSVFWPSAIPVQNQDGPALMEANPALYAAGVRRLNPQVMIVFGERAIADMGLSGRIKTFRQEMVEGRLLLLLPEIEELLRQSGQRLSAVSLLRAVLASVIFS